MNHSFAWVWVLIPLAGIASGMFHHWMKLKRAQLDQLTDQTAERAAQYAARSERLEQRVAVLERIITDRATYLGEEIERLRGMPVN